eukprot:UN12430
MQLQFEIEIYRDHWGNEKKKATNVDIITTQNRINTIAPVVISGKPWKANINKQIQQMNDGPCPKVPRHNRLHYSTHNRIKNTPKYKGYLLWFNQDKKHGFIECDCMHIIDDAFVYET